MLDDGTALTQSLAIIEYLEEHCPDPRLLPDDRVRRARARAAAMVITCEMHPVQNPMILARVRELAGEDAAQQWRGRRSRNAFELTSASEALDDLRSRDDWRT